MSMRNMAAMFGAMALLRKIDQEEPIVLLYVRVGYLCYVGITALFYIVLHFRILARQDTTLIDIPISSKAPSFSEAMEQTRKAAEKTEAEKSGQLNDNDSTNSTATANNNEQEEEEEEKEEEKVETITIMEYDLRQLANSRRSWVTSSCFLAAVHYHMQSVSPLFMSGIMGIIRLLTEDPLVQIHLRGTPATDKFARPFTPEKNPLASMLKDFAPKEENSDSTTTTTTPQLPNNNNNNHTLQNDELHDDGEEDDDDENSTSAANITNDDHIKSDFDDDENEQESKKDQ